MADKPLNNVEEFQAWVSKQREAAAEETKALWDKLSAKGEELYKDGKKLVVKDGKLDLSGAKAALGNVVDDLKKAGGAVIDEVEESGLWNAVKKNGGTLIGGGAAVMLGAALGLGPIGTIILALIGAFLGGMMDGKGSFIGDMMGMGKEKKDKKHVPGKELTVEPGAPDITTEPEKEPKVTITQKDGALSLVYQEVSQSGQLLTKTMEGSFSPEGVFQSNHTRIVLGDTVIADTQIGQPEQFPMKDGKLNIAQLEKQIIAGTKGLADEAEKMVKFDQKNKDRNKDRENEQQGKTDAPQNASPTSVTPDAATIREQKNIVMDKIKQQINNATITPVHEDETTATYKITLPDSKLVTSVRGTKQGNDLVLDSIDRGAGFKKGTPIILSDVIKDGKLDNEKAVNAIKEDLKDSASKIFSELEVGAKEGKPTTSPTPPAPAPETGLKGSPADKHYWGFGMDANSATPVFIPPFFGPLSIAVLGIGKVPETTTPAVAAAPEVKENTQLSLMGPNGPQKFITFYVNVDDKGVAHLSDKDKGNAVLLGVQEDGKDGQSQLRITHSLGRSADGTFKMAGQIPAMEPVLVGMQSTAVVPINGDAINLSDETTQRMVSKVATAAIGKQDAIVKTAEVVENRRLQAIEDAEKIARLTEINNNTKLTVVGEERNPVTGQVTYFFVQNGIFEDGKEYTAKFRGEFKRRRTAQGIPLDDLVIDRASFVKSKDDPIKDNILTDPIVFKESKINNGIVTNAWFSSALAARDYGQAQDFNRKVNVEPYKPAQVQTALIPGEQGRVATPGQQPTQTGRGPGG